MQKYIPVFATRSTKDISSTSQMPVVTSHKLKSSECLTLFSMGYSKNTIVWRGGGGRNYGPQS